MHCILLRGDSEVWRLRRSVEVLSYHRQEREVKILAVLSVEKLSAGPAYLFMLHRGTVQCSMVKSGRGARHPDEPVRDGDSIWWSVYNPEFEGSTLSITENDGVLTRIKKRNSWDSFYDLEAPKSITHLWPTSIPQDPIIKPCRQDPADADPVPFTEWELGPFNSKGEYLITVEMEFDGETYNRMLNSSASGDVEGFTVDGPKRVLDAIEHFDLVNLPPARRAAWEQRLEPYRKFLETKCYDVILLDPPCKSDQIEVTGKSRIMNAPVQPTPNGGRRFVSASPDFQLVLAYAGTNTVDSFDVSMAGGAEEK